MVPPQRDGRACPKEPKASHLDRGWIEKANLIVSCQGCYRSFLTSEFLHGPRRLLHYRYNNSLDNEQSAMRYLVWDDVVYAIREVLSRSGSLQTRALYLLYVVGSLVVACRPRDHLSCHSDRDRDDPGKKMSRGRKNNNKPPFLKEWYVLTYYLLVLAFLM